MQNNKVIIKKKRFNIIRFLIIILFLYITGYIVFNLLDSPIRNIYIKNNGYLSDQEIIDAAKLNDYPSFLFTTNNAIKKRLLENPLIKDVTVKKGFYGKIYITVIENKPLFYNKLKSRTVLSDSREVNTKHLVPVLINELPEGIYNKFITKMDNLSNDTLLKMSEIEYKPNEIDKERILVTMTDGNYVYLTLYKFENIDKYNDILPSLEGKRGILYFDSGNYFEIFN
jgi:cell division septal protein FtsQ